MLRTDKPKYLAGHLMAPVSCSSPLAPTFTLLACIQAIGSAGMIVPRLNSGRFKVSLFPSASIALPSLQPEHPVHAAELSFGCQSNIF